MQRINRDLTFDGFARRLVYELRVEWDPSVDGDESPARVTRQLLTVNGRPPRKATSLSAWIRESVSPEPLAFLLPDRSVTNTRSRAPASGAWMDATR